MPPRHRLARDQIGALTQTRKEILQQGCTRGLFEAADDFWRVVTGRLAEDTRAVFHTAALRIISPKNQPANARKRYGLRAHGAGLQGHIQVAVGQTRCFQFFRRRPERQNFGMARRITILLHTVGGTCQDAARGHLDHNRSDRHFTVGRGETRFFQRLRHICRFNHARNGARALLKLQRRRCAA